MAGYDINSIAELLRGKGLSQISQSVGADEKSVANVLGYALPTLVTSMQQNASTEEGAASLSHALEQHSGVDLSDVAAFLNEADQEDGDKIIGHILGDNKEATTEELARGSGLSGSAVSSILSLVAPLLLSSLGNQQAANTSNNTGINLGSLLGGMLGGGMTQQAAPASTGLLGGLLGGAAAPQQQTTQNAGGLLGGLFGGAQQQAQPVQQQAPAFNNASLISSLLGGLFTDDGAEASGGLQLDTEATAAAQQAQQTVQQEEEKEEGNSLLGSFFNLFR
ncbi:MAG: DUF937 domain-containing protein [Firmicutes bacterium]|nr:DUF937 domain-containing protein [Bacillota bacterium]